MERRNEINDKVICICNEVSEQEIEIAIKTRKARSLQDISLLTGAGTGCGRCRRSVRGVLKKNL
jgi:bacterioferritin-associated ferredoxin